MATVFEQLYGRKSNLGTQNADLAGKRVKNGNTTVVYDDQGRAVSEIRDGGRSANHFTKTTHANDSATHQAMYEAAKNNDWDKVGLLSHDLLTPTGRTDAAGAPVYDTSAADGYIQELANEFGVDFNNYVSKKYDSVYGEGAYDGGTGTGEPVYNDFSRNLVEQYYAGQGGMPGQESPAQKSSGYDDFDSFLSTMGYDSYAAETQRAIQAAVQKAVNEINTQITNTEEESEELARQAYVAHMLGMKNMDQQLAAAGYSGGMADSQRIAMEASYQNDLNALNRQKEATIRELQSAITNAQLTGDMQVAQELSGFMQNIQSQWNNYLMTQQALEDQNYWKQQSLNAEQQANARTLALAMIEQGRMPDAATLAAADMTAGQAQILLGTVGAMGTTGNGVVGKRTGGGYDNEGLDAGTVQFMQELLGVTADGMWGQQSRGVTDMGAADSWEEIKEIMAEGGMAVAHFDAYARSITQLVQQGYADRAREMLASISGQLSADQLKYLQRKIEGR